MRAILDSTFGRTGCSDFAVRLWDDTWWPAPPVKPPVFTLVLKQPSSLRDLLLARDDLGPGEAYMRGDIDVEGDIHAAIALVERLRQVHLPLPERLAIAARLLALPRGHSTTVYTAAAHTNGRLHSLRRDRSAVRHHYDVANDFYALWLDRRMVYSCAYFATAADDLDEAQRQKLDYICRKLRLRAGERLLDIGCGWGALPIYAALHYGVDAVGISLSPPQVELARERVRDAGLEKRVRIELLDYRELRDERGFDKIASIGMFEHVGARRAPEYFAQAWRLLRPQGVFLLHAIAGRDGVGTRPASRFSNRYVFPDHELIPIGATLKVAERCGFEVRDVESLREHYALTLRSWLRRLDAARDDAVRCASEQIYRAWRLVFAAAVHRFATGNITVYQTLLARPAEGVSGLPLRRADWYNGR